MTEQAPQKLHPLALVAVFLVVGGIGAFFVMKSLPDPTSSGGGSENASSKELERDKLEATAQRDQARASFEAEKALRKLKSEADRVSKDLTEVLELSSKWHSRVAGVLESEDGRFIASADEFIREFTRLQETTYIAPQEIEFAQKSVALVLEDVDRKLQAGEPYSPPVFSKRNITEDTSRALEDKPRLKLSLHALDELLETARNAGKKASDTLGASIDDLRARQTAAEIAARAEAERARAEEERLRDVERKNLARNDDVIKLLDFCLDPAGIPSTFSWVLSHMGEAYQTEDAFQKKAIESLKRKFYVKFKNGGQTDEYHRRNERGKRVFEKSLYEMFRAVVDFRQEEFFLSPEDVERFIARTSPTRQNQKLLADLRKKTVPDGPPLPPAREMPVGIAIEDREEPEQEDLKLWHLAYDTEAHRLLDFAVALHGFKYPFTWRESRLGPIYDSEDAFREYAESSLAYYYKVGDAVGDIVQRDKLSQERFGVSLHRLFQILIERNRHLFLSDDEVQAFLAHERDTAADLLKKKTAGTRLPEPLTPPDGFEPPPSKGPATLWALAHDDDAVGLLDFILAAAGKKHGRVCRLDRLASKYYSLDEFTSHLKAAIRTEKREYRQSNTYIAETIRKRSETALEKYGFSLYQIFRIVVERRRDLFLNEEDLPAFKKIWQGNQGIAKELRARADGIRLPEPIPAPGQG